MLENQQRVSRQTSNMLLAQTMLQIESRGIAGQAEIRYAEQTPTYKAIRGGVRDG